MAVVDIERVRVRELDIAIALVHDVRAVVLPSLRDGVWQPAAWVDLPEQDVDQRVAALLAGQVGPDHGGDVGVIDPWLDKHRTDAVDNDDSVVTY